MSISARAIGAGAAILLAGTALAGGSDDAGAQPGQTTSKQKAGTYDPAKLRMVTLTVKQVDKRNHKVTFEATVKPEATTSSGKPIKLDQLKEGDTIKAAFDPKTGDVVRVDVTPAAHK
jgi:Cu/Ag efflux protein CusF